MFFVCFVLYAAVLPYVAIIYHICNDCHVKCGMSHRRFLCRVLWVALRQHKPSAGHQSCRPRCIQDTFSALFVPCSRRVHIVFTSSSLTHLVTVPGALGATFNEEILSPHSLCKTLGSQVVLDVSVCVSWPRRKKLRGTMPLPCHRTGEIQVLREFRIGSQMCDICAIIHTE